MNPDWRIKVRCTKLYPLRTYWNDWGEGKIQNLEFMDAYGGMIEGSMFNLDVDKFLPMVWEGGVYIISNASIKVANQKFAKVKNDYCIVFTGYTSIKEVDEDLNISKRGFSTTSISKLFALTPPPSTADVMGVVVAMGECAEINTKSGLRAKWNLTLLDWSVPDDPSAVNPSPKLWGAKINATMWGEKSKSPSFDIGSVVCFKGAQFSEF